MFVVADARLDMWLWFISGVPITFAEVAELARSTNQTAIGYIHKPRHSSSSSSSAKSSHSTHSSSSSSSSSPPGTHTGSPQPRKLLRSLSAVADVELALPASEVITFEEGDCVVVLARDFVV
jgi:hypothetical protein